MALTSAGRLRRAWRSRVTILSLGAFIVAVVLFAVITAITGNSDTPSSSGPNSNAAAPARGLATDTDQSIPIYPFPVQWKTWETIALPEGGVAYGPLRHIGGAVVDGFADTPRSGIVAAIQLSTRAVFAVHPDWEPLLGDMVLPGPGRDVLASYHAQQPGRLVLPDGGLPQIVGFKVLAYSPAVLVVNLAEQRVPQEPVTVLTVTVRWSGGWKLELQPTGTPAANAYQTDRLPSDFVQFGPPW